LVGAFGGDPQSATAVLQAANAVDDVLSAQDMGNNEHYADFELRNGYVPCSIKWNVNSYTGDIWFSGSFSPHRFEFYADVPRQRWTEGGEWVKAAVEMHFIKEPHYQAARNAGRCGATGETAFGVAGEDKDPARYPRGPEIGTYPPGAD
jgi:hypothetical protein